MEHVKLPTLSTLRRPQTAERLLPLAIGAGLLAAGAMLWRARPRALDMPDPLPLPDHSESSLFHRAVRRSRDGMGVIAPDNLGVSVGRSMAIAGAALVITRLLDELSETQR